MIHLFLMAIINLSLCYLFFLELENQDRFINEQLRLYQCSINQLNNLRTTYQRLNKLNKIIRLTHLGVLLPGLGKLTSKQIQKTAMISQEFIWMNHLKNVLREKYCKKIIYQSFLLSAPYQRGTLKFKRNIDQTIKKSKKNYQKFTYNPQTKSGVHFKWRKGKLKSTFIADKDISQLNYPWPSSLFSRPFLPLSR